MGDAGAGLTGVHLGANLVTQAWGIIRTAQGAHDRRSAAFRSLEDTRNQYTRYHQGNLDEYTTNSDESARRHEQVSYRMLRRERPGLGASLDGLGRQFMYDQHAAQRSGHAMDEQREALNRSLEWHERRVQRRIRRAEGTYQLPERGNSTLHREPYAYIEHVDSDDYVDVQPVAQSQPHPQDSMPETGGLQIEGVELHTVLQPNTQINSMTPLTPVVTSQMSSPQTVLQSLESTPRADVIYDYETPPSEGSRSASPRVDMEGEWNAYDSARFQVVTRRNSSKRSRASPAGAQHISHFSGGDESSYRAHQTSEFVQTPLYADDYGYHADYSNSASSRNSGSSFGEDLQGYAPHQRVTW